MKYVYTNFILLMCLSFALMGCGKEDNTQIETNEEQTISSVFQVDQTIDRSLDDITVHREPLIKRETIYYFSSGYRYIVEYTYDSKNRYSKIQQNVIEPNQEEQVINWIAEYSYDDYFYYVTTTYLQKENMVTTDIYDIYNNPVQSQYEGLNGMITEFSQYKYLCDTKEKQEVITYIKREDEVEWEYRHSIKAFNEQGDMIYCINQVGNSCFYEEVYEYEYDKDNRIVYSYMTSDYLSTVEIHNSYDDKGRLIETVENHEQQGEENFWGNKRQVIITYEYDECDRLVKKEKSRLNEDDEKRKDIVIVYEYVEK